MTCCVVTPASRQAIWECVRKIRQLPGAENEHYFDIVLFLENVIPTISPNFTFEVVPQTEMKNVHGETLPDEDTIRIREDVYDGACLENGRNRLTIAHELGHFLMHDRRNLLFFQVEKGRQIPAFLNAEWQADAFAGELLAPSYLIDGMTAEEIQAEFHVSLPCAKSQLRAIERERAKGKFPRHF